MQTSEMAAQAVAVVALVRSGGVTVARGNATRVLGELISVRLSRAEPGRQAWHDFQFDPYDDSLVCRLLQQELEWDNSFRDQFMRQLAQVSGAPPPHQRASHCGHLDDSVRHSATIRVAARGGSPIAGIAATVLARVRRVPSPAPGDRIRSHGPHG